MGYGWVMGDVLITMAKGGYKEFFSLYGIAKVCPELRKFKAVTAVAFMFANRQRNKGKRQQ